MTTNVSKIKRQTFIEAMIPKMGPAVFTNLNTATLAAVVEILKRKGILTSEELEFEVENQLGNLVKSIENMPIPSPFQAQAK